MHTCSTRLLAAMCCIMRQPMVVISSIESGTERERPKRMRLAPNIPEEMAIIFPRPMTVRRRARAVDQALVTAPTPDAPTRNPKVCASPWRTFPAMIGARTVYGHVPTITAHKTEQQ